MKHAYGKFHSWNIISETVGVKQSDKSFFDYNGSGVPADILWFFEVENLENGSRKSIDFSFKGKEYKGHIEREANDTGRVRIFWETKLGRALSIYENEAVYPEFQFEKIKDNYYDIVLKQNGSVLTDIDYIGVLKYLENNQEIPYSKPDAAGLSTEKKKELLQIKERGQNAVAEMKKMAQHADKAYELGKCLPGSWLDGSNTKTRKYLWTQMKYKSDTTNPVSVSIFVETGKGNKAYFRVSLEIKNDNADNEMMQRYHKHLELLQKAGLVYVEGSNEWGNPQVLTEDQATVSAKVANDTYKKVQICKMIEQVDGKTNDDYHEEVMDAIGEIIPYYDHVLGKGIPEKEKRCWMLNWNPDKWPWGEYEEWCQGTKLGEKYTIAWTCSSKQPALGDDVFLMKTGEQPRGIMAHGIVAAESYEGLHYDPDKAIEGKTASHIDVEFDWIQNVYDGEKMLLQDDLKHTYPTHSWSSMSSGIEIKEPIAMSLKDDWNKLINGTDYEEKGEITAMKKIDFPKNAILYGPPGTGKTYGTAIYAVAIIENKDIEAVKAESYDEVFARYTKYKEDGLVAFTTFHQSYGYEEFIEGIKPVVDEGVDDIGYRIEAGVFKTFCERANMLNTDGVASDAKVWKVVLGSSDLVHSNPVKFDCENYNKIMFDWKLPEDHEGEYAAYQIEHFKNRVNVGDIVVSYAGNGTDIDYIGVVTGDAIYDETANSYRWSRTVKWLEMNNVKNIYELNGNTYLDNTQLQPLKRIKAADILRLINSGEYTSNNKNYVFIIDEINRGNISKIFGELITLIEDTKRAGMDEAASAILPYSGEMFSVPSNVYILGTMNTADRSIALMDTALRRRFQFIEMMPDADVLRAIGADKVDDLDVAAMLEKINERISFLYDREHTIGHAFFTKLAKDPAVDTLKSIFEKSVIPLLQEYFYEDYQKIQLVLGDNGKSDNAHKFILDSDVKVKDIFKGSADDVIDLPEKTYTINPVAFDIIDSYKEII